MNRNNSLVPFASALLFLGCGPDLVMATDDGGVGSTTEATPMTTSGTTLASSSDEGPLADSSGGTTSMSGSFLENPDVGSGQFECDVFVQDCPLGFKCTWSNPPGSSFWDVHRCRPIADDPRAPGEPCTVEGDTYSGNDDCQLGVICWNVDPEFNEGICIGLCSGSEDFPICEDPNTQCAIPGGGGPWTCQSMCDPVTQDCPKGQACYPVNGQWQCIPDASGDMGAYGEPCEFINACGVGLICLGAAAVPDCVGSSSCCTEICDLSSREGDAQCTGAPQGQTCQAWYEPGAAPPGYENVGVCTLPQ